MAKSSRVPLRLGKQRKTGAMGKRHIFTHRRKAKGTPLAVAIILLFALAIWAGTGPDPDLPPIYLRAAPMEGPLND
jgi:hypothetical protein